MWPCLRIGCLGVDAVRTGRFGACPVPHFKKRAARGSPKANRNLRILLLFHTRPDHGWCIINAAQGESRGFNLTWSVQCCCPVRVSVCIPDIAWSILRAGSRLGACTRDPTAAHLGCAWST
jgi:hypothetical protein